MNAAAGRPRSRDESSAVLEELEFMQCDNETVRRLVRRKMLRKSPGADSNSKGRDSTVFGGGGWALSSVNTLKKWPRSGPEKILAFVSMVGPAGFEPATKRL